MRVASRHVPLSNAIVWRRLTAAVLRHIGQRNTGPDGTTEDGSAIERKHVVYTCPPGRGGGRRKEKKKKKRGEGKCRVSPRLCVVDLF